MSRREIFQTKRKTILGMVHLPPLPGSPEFEGDWEKTIKLAEADAKTLVDGGVHGVIVENYGDAPFYPDQVPAITNSCMAVVLARVKRILGNLPMGVNVLRNDGITALALAAAVQAQFIRVNVHSGVMVTDQGVLVGRAYDLVRTRNAWCPQVAIFADVHVKHGTPLVPEDVVQAAQDAHERGKADALILTGKATGSKVDIKDLITIRQSLPTVYLVVGSGVAVENLEVILPYCDAAIVGTSLKRDSNIHSPVDLDRVLKFMATAERFSR